MALSIDECHPMIDAPNERAVQLIVGHSIASTHRSCGLGSSSVGHGRPFTMRPRSTSRFHLPTAAAGRMSTREGGGVIFSSSRTSSTSRAFSGRPGSNARARSRGNGSVRAPRRLFSAAAFEEAHSHRSPIAYAHFDSDELLRDIGALGDRVGTRRGTAPHAARSRASALLRQKRAQSRARYAVSQQQVPRLRLGMNRAGMTAIFRIISTSVSSWRVCERADLRPMPDRVLIYDDSEVRTESLPPPTILA